LSIGSSVFWLSNKKRQGRLGVRYNSMHKCKNQLSRFQHEPPYSLALSDFTELTGPTFVLKKNCNAWAMYKKKPLLLQQRSF